MKPFYYLPAMNKAVIILGAIFFLSCGNSKKRMVGEMEQRLQFWRDRYKQYRDVSIVHSSADTIKHYTAIADTAEKNIVAIMDSLFRLTGYYRYDTRR